MLELLLFSGGKRPAKPGSYSTHMHTLLPRVKDVKGGNEQETY